MTTETRPEFCTDEMLEFLDDLRESGDTNMFGARPYIENRFEDLTSKEASKVLLYWMSSFSERQGLTGSRKI